MNSLFRVTVVGAIVWSGLSAFKSVVASLKEEELARAGAGESDYQRHHPTKDKQGADDLQSHHSR
ncbi:MAG: hypothetical protein V1746_02115 [bacterium]